MVGGYHVGQCSSALPLVLSDRINSRISTVMSIARAVVTFGVFFLMILSLFIFQGDQWNRTILSNLPMKNPLLEYSFQYASVGATEKVSLAAPCFLGLASLLCFTSVKNLLVMWSYIFNTSLRDKISSGFQLKEHYCMTEF